MRIEFHDEAMELLNDSTECYSARSPETGVRFADAIANALAKVIAMPLRFPLIPGRPMRACGVERFPFQIIFRIDAERLFIVAVSHVKCRPGYWMG